MLKRLTLTVLAGLALSFAQAKAADKLTIATFGGSFINDTKTCVIAPFTKTTGSPVVVQLGNSVQLAAAIRAMGGRSAYDVVYLDNSLATELENEGLLQPLDVSKLQSYPQIDKSAFGPGNDYVTFEVSATALVYDPTVIKTPPTSWADLFDPKYRGRMALGDITGTSGMQTMLAINRLKGGTLDNVKPGMDAMKTLIPGAVTLYTQADQLLALFQQGDIVIAPWYPDRAGAAILKGYSLAVAYPKEGAVGIRPVLVIPKGDAHPELALKYIDTVLSAPAQTCFTEREYAAPVNTTVKLSPEVSKIVATGDNYKRLWFPDPETLAKHLPDWIREWQRQVAN
ncbi:ABC transporter substrate-binding protein [Acidisoma cellulosilytica]|uniref:ABC transporter substrate-binding protein n=1 Tax=Acidisoma cellulosilyticum TaxID=2802395 RepID=A0A964E673_9PROT|nr:ABC transporter substrate-binding protein [Acidisoma cellulosilyticum]MCB8882723.1 ABC transporter substrate-binding protein [Acidisoma cellulosilyticum]